MLLRSWSLAGHKPDCCFKGGPASRSLLGLPVATPGATAQLPGTPGVARKIKQNKTPQVPLSALFALPPPPPPPPHQQQHHPCGHAPRGACSTRRWILTTTIYLLSDTRRGGNDFNHEFHILLIKLLPVGEGWVGPHAEALPHWCYQSPDPSLPKACR